MSALHSITRTSRPPPPAVFRLLDGTGTVGWIADNRLSFTGFSSIPEAATAAWVAHVALERRAAKSRREPAPYLEPSEMQLVRSGGSEWIHSAGTRLARLVRPLQRATDEVGDPSGAWFGIEIVLLPDASDLTVGSSAHVVYRALRRSGMRWPIRNRPAGVTRATEAKYSEELSYAELAAAEAQVSERGRPIMSDQPNDSNARNTDLRTDDVDSASLDSFPASDPPKWSSLRVGPPVEAEPARAAQEQKDNTSGQARPGRRRQRTVRLHGGT